MLNDLITPELTTLRQHFVNAGYDIRFVGGCVRDSLINKAPKDIDLCTNATPEEQINVYKTAGYRWIETGLQHGTVTVMIDHVPYEITSLRIDVETDGRHAKVEYTRDWEEDLERRDLTINAMSYTFDGELVDPYNGQDHLSNGIIQFVGQPRERIEEDYLRILRYFRFYGRFGDIDALKRMLVVGHTSYDHDDVDVKAIRIFRHGLEAISGERIWSEYSRILQNENFLDIMLFMDYTKVHEVLGIPDWDNYLQLDMRRTKDPVFIMANILGFDIDKINKFADKWKWSNIERKKALWISDRLKDNGCFDVDFRRLIAFDNVPREWIIEFLSLLDFDEFTIEMAKNWVMPDFPVNGHDLKERYELQGPAIGKSLAFLKDVWADNNYASTKEELLKYL